MLQKQDLHTILRKKSASIVPNYFVEYWVSVQHNCVLYSNKLHAQFSPDRSSGCVWN